MTKKKLPIGIQTFRKIREDNCYYVDKTGFACRLAEEGSHYFLSRPRRFGFTVFALVRLNFNFNFLKFGLGRGGYGRGYFTASCQTSGSEKTSQIALSVCG
jgi:hypothetical protein